MKNQLRENLKQVKHYQNHPQMRPFIGDNYGETYKKLLIVAESHYISNCDENSIPRDSDEYSNTLKNWYDIKMTDLKDYDIKWTNTSNIIYYSNLIDDKNPQCHKIHSNINSVLKGSKISKQNSDDKLFKHIAFMNFFQKPARDRDSINPINKDIEIANETLFEVAEILKPDFIFIVSSKAYDYLDKGKFKNYTIGHSSHPNSPSWNKKCKKYTNVNKRDELSGRESFADFVTFHEIFK